MGRSKRKDGRGRTLRIGPFLVGAFVLAAVFGPYLATHDPSAIDLRQQFQSPGMGHWLGTGDNGVDLLSALLHGARLAGIIAFWVVLVSSLVGTLIGTVAGYFGGRVDHMVGALMDLVQSFPGILLNIAILALVARPGVSHLVLALCVPGWVLYARLARAEALVLRDAEFVQAARALGASPAHTIIHHVIPNLAGSILIQATSGVGGVILAEATLSFLGLGPGSEVSWGALLDQGSGVLLRFPHVALVAGAAIAATVLGFNLSGDLLRDRLAVEGR